MSVDARCRVYGALWLFAAVVLVWRGLPYLGVGDGARVALAGGEVVVALAAAAVLGVAKGLTVMRRAAHKARVRIATAGERGGLGTVFRGPVLLLIVGMMALGLTLRLAPYPDRWRAWVVGVVYPAVALALVLGSAPLLRAGGSPRGG